MPLGELSGYVRALVNYSASNPRAGADLTFEANDYAIADLFLGLRSPSDNWEASVFAKNLFNDNTILTRGNYLNGLGGNLYSPANPSSGFRSFTRVAKREVGLTLRYRFGS